jgi:peptidoglycan/LPS O-acetylase OafA/YrhL
VDDQGVPVIRALDAAPDPDAPKRLPVLDGARGVAALLVLVSHSANAALLPPALGAGAGHVGVILFFLLSGFLMAYLYADRPFTGANIATYARHRIGRVVPLFLVVVLASWALAGHVDPRVELFDVGHTADLRDHLVLLRGEHTLWTIPVEIHFYAVFLLVWWATSKRRSDLALVVLLLVFGAGLGLLKHEHVADRYLPYWAHFFLLGSLVGLLWRRHHARIARWVDARRVVMDVAGWVVVVVSILALPGMRKEIGVEPMADYIDPITVAAPIAFFLCTLLGCGPLRGLAWQPLRWLGDVSYGIYIFQWPILMTMVHFFPSFGPLGPLLFGIVVAMVIGLAWVSSRLIERPAQDAINGRRTR